MMNSKILWAADSLWANAASKSGLRRAGILLHPTSLPSAYGSGDFGYSAYAFVDFLAQAKQTCAAAPPKERTPSHSEPEL